MSIKVRDCMNPVIVYIREETRPVLALRPILELGITSVPVLDEDGRPVGFVSLRDLVDRNKKSARVTEGAICIRITDPIEDAGRVLSEANVHHLVVVDERGIAVGMISSLDVVRGLLGRTATHPRTIREFLSDSEDAASETAVRP